MGWLSEYLFRVSRFDGFEHDFDLARDPIEIPQQECRITSYRD